MEKLKSIFRYPGGKLKAIKFIRPFWEQVKHDEYREPFLGGGSVFINKPLSEFNWINDIDSDLIAFYKVIADAKMRKDLIFDLENTKINKKMYEDLFNAKPKNFYEKASRYYILNRCSFSGITMWKSFIGDARFNIKSAKKTIEETGLKLSDVKITNLDFEDVIKARPEGEKEVFLFLDPPYAESRQIVAYAHSFKKDDHIRLAKLLKETKVKFLLTYDDCKFIRDLYNWANFYERTWTYSVANARVHFNPREHGNELFISNFKLKDNKSLLSFV